MEPTIASNNENQITDNNMYNLWQKLTDFFEEYEQLILNTNNPCKFDMISDVQFSCSTILSEILQLEDNDMYFTALLHIREELLNQMRIIDTKKEQFILNDLTITRIDNFSNHCEPLPKMHTLSTCSQNNYQEGEMAPRKKICMNKKTELISIIESTLVVPFMKGLHEVAGLKNEKHLLKKAIVYPVLYPHLFNGIRKRMNRILLYGPPGTGKTQLANCLAAEVNAQFYNISSADLLSRYVGESEKLIKILFQHCQNTSQQSLIFVDEIDSLCRKRSSKDAEFERRFKNELLNQLSAIDRNPDNKVFFIGCTNCPWDLDPAFIRRFQLRIYIPLPDRNARLELLKLQTQSIENLIIFDKEWNNILDRTDGYSGSDLADLVNFALCQPLNDLEDASHWVLTEENKYMPIKNNYTGSIKRKLEELPANLVTVRAVQMSDFYLALENVTKTVTPDSIEHFETFGKIYTNK